MLFLKVEDAPAEMVHSESERLAEGIPFGAEVNVEGARCDARLLGQGVDSRSCVPAFAKCTSGSLKNALTRLRLLFSS